MSEEVARTHELVGRLHKAQQDMDRRIKVLEHKRSSDGTIEAIRKLVDL